MGLIPQVVTPTITVPVVNTQISTDCIALALAFIPDSFLISMIDTITLAQGTITFYIAKLETEILTLQFLLAPIDAEILVLQSIVNNLFSSVTAISGSLVALCPSLGILNDAVVKTGKPYLDKLNAKIAIYQRKNAAVQDITNDIAEYQDYLNILSQVKAELIKIQANRTNAIGSATVYGSLDATVSGYKNQLSQAWELNRPNAAFAKVNK